MWIVWNKILAESAVNSLNPHWVSFVFTPHTIVLINPNTLDTSFLWNLRSTLALSPFDPVTSYSSK